MCNGGLETCQIDHSFTNLLSMTKLAHLHSKKTLYSKIVRCDPGDERRASNVVGIHVANYTVYVSFCSKINNTLCTMGRPNRVKNTIITNKTASFNWLL